MGDEQWRAEDGKARAEIAKLDREAADETPAMSFTDDDVKRFREVMASAAVSVPAKQKILRGLIKRVVVGSEAVEIHYHHRRWHGWSDTDTLPRPRRNYVRS